VNSFRHNYRPLVHLDATDGTRLHLEVAGPEDGAVVILVHGLAGSIELSWRALGTIDRLVAGGVRVVAMDLRGHGHTATDGAPERFEQGRLVDDVRAVVEHHRGRRVVVVGYSLGAALVLLALQDGLHVDQAVIAGAAPSVLAWTDEDERRRVQTAAALRGSTDVDPDLVGFVGFFRSIGADVEALAQLFDHHHPTVSDWEAIATPVVVVAGADDDMAAPVEELVARLPNATAARVPGDHFTAAGTTEFAALVLAAANG
jgi:pimeloyl-ACP methyl ester carboxylesterase